MLSEKKSQNWPSNYDDGLSREFLNRIKEKHGPSLSGNPYPILH